jgi:HlyD family secretion protein
MMKDPLATLRRPANGDSSPPSAALARPRRGRPWLGRYGPWGLLLLALFLGWHLFGERLLPASRVVVETVVATRSDRGEGERAVLPSGIDPYEGAVRFQASGWLESDPFPHRVTALVSGVIETVHVLEGESVAAGRPIVSLIRDDAALERDRAKGMLAASRAATAAAGSEHALSLARVESMTSRIRVAEARREELADLAARARELGSEVVSSQDIRQAELRLKTQEATVAALAAERSVDEQETRRLADQWDLRRAEEAAAEAILARAELALRRTVVTAPVDGVVQRLLATPGQKKMLPGDDPDSATVALLFDPARLQARIDVPLAEASGLFPGQAVLVETEYFPGRVLRGEVTRIVGEADLQRNTLQAKVRVLQPPPGWRPDILCRAKFLETRVGGEPPAGAGADSSPGQGEGGGLALFVPGRALFAVEGREASCWAIDASGRRLELRRLELGNERREDYRAVRSGLRPGDRVVLDPAPELEEGQRVRSSTPHNGKGS